jgi:hypothetical protein
MSEAALKGLREAQQRMVEKFQATTTSITLTNGELLGIQLMLKDWMRLKEEHNTGGNDLNDVAASVIGKIENHYK